MVQGMAFLSKKGFNPTNQTNRKQVYEAQQDAKIKSEKVRKRQEQLRREKDEEELARVRGGEHGGRKSQLSFMYQAPPGLTKTTTQQEEEDQAQIFAATRKNNTSAADDLTQMQVGDDEAAAAFRMLLASHQEKEEDPEHPHENGATHKFTPVLQGTSVDAQRNGDMMTIAEKKEQQKNDTRSALERAVGRKDKGGALSWEEQVARFPQLKNAPMAKGMSSTDVNVSFKPLGAQMRNVKCMACGIWGHSRGDRECSKTGWNPFNMATAKVEASSGIMPDAKKKALPEEDSDDSSTDKKRKKKRHRKHRKHRKHRRHDSDASSENSEADSKSDDDDNRRRRKHRHRSRRDDDRRKRGKESGSRKRSKDDEGERKDD